MMAFSRAWDETFPPDTQVANLLGQDIRNFKTDIRERLVAFAAGPIADQPTPDAVFGSANDGVMYFATDTGHVFRWNGSAWVDITTLFFAPIPTGPADSGHFFRGDSTWANTLVGDLTVTDLIATANVIANAVNATGAITADNFVATNGIGNTVSRGGETGNFVISGNNVNITFQSDGTNLDLYINGVFVKHVALF